MRIQTVALRIHHASLAAVHLSGFVFMGTTLLARSRQGIELDFDGIAITLLGYAISLGLVLTGLILGILGLNEEQSRFWKFSGIACAFFVPGIWSIWILARISQWERLWETFQ